MESELVYVCMYVCMYVCISMSVKLSAPGGKTVFKL